MVTTRRPGDLGYDTTTRDGSRSADHGDFFDNMAGPPTSFGRSDDCDQRILSDRALRRTFGSRSYPVGYGYDVQGRMTKMTNWTGFSMATGTRVTTWNYDGYRGFLTNKVFDGAAPDRATVTRPLAAFKRAPGRGESPPPIPTTITETCRA